MTASQSDIHLRTETDDNIYLCCDRCDRELINYGDEVRIGLALFDAQEHYDICETPDERAVREAAEEDAADDEPHWPCNIPDGLGGCTVCGGPPCMYKRYLSEGWG